MESEKSGRSTGGHPEYSNSFNDVGGEVGSNEVTQAAWFTSPARTGGSWREVARSNQKRVNPGMGLNRYLPDKEQQPIDPGRS